MSYDYPVLQFSLYLPFMVYPSDFQSAISSPAFSASPGTLLEMQSLGPTPHILNLELWVRTQQSVLTSPPCDFGAHSSLRTSALAFAYFTKH